MIVGFSSHGKGSGRGPVGYMVDPARAGRENAPPVVLRGNPDQTTTLIDSLAFSWKYTSGVLSFAPGEVITREMETAIMDRFEALAFAGLESDQYNIMWVRHSHAGHHELHFVTPRVELSTGKSLNIKPPGDLAQDQFDAFRNEVNARYGLADPTDPDRARNVATPNHELKLAAEARRSGLEPSDNMRELIDSLLTHRAELGLIRSRSDLLEHVKDLSLDVTREGKDYITVHDPESGQRWRLKGALYAREFTPSSTIEKADSRRGQDFSRPDAGAYQRFEERVNGHIRSRAEYHQGRYRSPESVVRLAVAKEPALVADDNGPDALSRHLRRALGRDAVPREPVSREAAEIGPDGGRDHAAGESVGLPEIGGRGDPVQHMRRSEVHPDRRGRTDLREWLPDTEGVLSDRVGDTIAGRLRALTAAIQDRASSIANDVRRYLKGKHELAEAGDRLERASDKLGRAGVDLEQSASEMKRQKAPNRGYGPSGP